MKTKNFLLGTALFAVVFLLLGSGCVRQGKASSAGYKIAASIFPVYDLARSVAGADLETVLLLKPGISPHTFEPAPSDIKRLSGARIIFTIGLGLDGWVEKLAANAGSGRVVTVSRNIRLRNISRGHHDRDDEKAGSSDPHYWMTAGNAIIIAENIKNELAGTFPEKAARFEKNFGQLRTELLALDRELRDGLKNIKNKKLATFHESFGYFADEYGLTLAAVFEPFSGKEPTPLYLKGLAADIKSAGVKAIFGEPQSSFRSLEPIAADLKIRVSVLDDIGGTDGNDTYLKLMRYNLRQIDRALE
jgi:zinc transport system substrate-binding protein